MVSTAQIASYKKAKARLEAELARTDISNAVRRSNERELATIMNVLGDTKIELTTSPATPIKDYSSTSITKSVATSKIYVPTEAEQLHQQSFITPPTTPTKKTTAQKIIDIVQGTSTNKSQQIADIAIKAEQAQNKKASIQPTGDYVSLGEQLALNLRQGAENLGQVIPNLVDPTLNMITDVPKELGSSVGTGIGSVGQGAGVGLAGVGTGIGSGVEDILTGTGTGIGQGVAQVGTGVGQGVGGAFGGASSGLSEALPTVALYLVGGLVAYAVVKKL